VTADVWTTPERRALRESAAARHYCNVRLLGIGGGATEVLADLAGRLLGYTAAGAR
jgi:alkylation response protein AidB-like acyl-CoA dehydrogenase